MRPVDETNDAWSMFYMISPLTIGKTRLDWGSRTFVMGILNITPDSFSGDGLLAAEREGCLWLRQAA